jgi:divalent metal cation (Fe/Co/Zn/Cd) transporter
MDTVYVYHFGTRFLVEVHIVLDENMRLKEAHDISESLQNSIEALPGGLGEYNTHIPVGHGSWTLSFKLKV